MHSVKIIYLIVIVIVSLSNIYCNKDADKNVLQQIIDRLNASQKEQILQLLLKTSNSNRQDNSNWCCNIDPGE